MQSFGTIRVNTSGQFRLLKSEESLPQKHRSGTSPLHLGASRIGLATASRHRIRTQCSTAMNKTLRVVVWGSVALPGRAGSWRWLRCIAASRSTPSGWSWPRFAATPLGYSFYSAFIAAKFLRSIRCAPRLPSDWITAATSWSTNKWVVFGHHFAAIAGPGPLVGPVLAASLDILPGTLWVHCGRCVCRLRAGFRDPALFGSPRRQIADRNGQGRNRSLGGFVAYVAVIAILIILLAVMRSSW